MISFCWKASFNAAKTFEMIQQVYGESAIHRTIMFCWCNVFSEERESICDEQRSKRLTTTTSENIAHIADILKEDHWCCCRHIAERMGIPKTIAQQILREDLQKWKLYVWFVPLVLTAEQKEQHFNHAYDLIETIKSDPNILDSIITGDESWCFAFDLETKCQSSKWCGPNSPSSKKF